MRDFTDDLRDLRRRLGEAALYLKVEQNTSRLSELEIEITRPDLWDDQDLAKKVNTEYSNIKSDLDEFLGLTAVVDYLDVLHEMAREVDDASQEPELADGISRASKQLRTLELRSLFTG